MPSINASDIPSSEGSSRVLPLIIGAVLFCGVGFGIYHFVGPSTAEPVKPVAMPIPPEVNTLLKQKMENVKARQAQRDDQFKISLGLSNSQLGQLASIESETTNPREKAEKIRGMMSADQWDKYRQHNPDMRWAGGWGGRGGPSGTGGPGGPQGQGRRRRDGGGTSDTQPNNG